MPLPPQPSPGMEDTFTHISDARMAVISAGAADDPRVG